MSLMPKSVRYPLIRKMVRFPIPYPEGMRFRLARSQDDYYAAFRILHDEYVRSGYASATDSKVRITPYHCMPSSPVVVAESAGKIIGTITLVRDSRLGMPMDKIFDLSEYRNTGARMVEASGLAVARDHRGEKGFVFFGLLRYAYLYARDFLGTQYFVCAVNPKMVDVYCAVFGFEEIPQRVINDYSFVKGAPAVGLIFRMNRFEENMRKYYRHLPEDRNAYNFFFKPPAGENTLPERSTPSLNDAYLLKDQPQIFYEELDQLRTQWSPEERLAIVRANRFDPTLASMLLEEHICPIPVKETDPRFDVYFPISLRSELTGSEQTAWVLDVSKHGLRIATPDIHGVDSVFKGHRDYSFKIVQNGQNILGQTKLVWDAPSARLMGLYIQNHNPYWHDFIQCIQATQACYEPSRTLLRAVG